MAEAETKLHDLYLQLESVIGMLEGERERAAKFRKEVLERLETIEDTLLAD